MTREITCCGQPAYLPNSGQRGLHGIGFCLSPGWMRETTMKTSEPEPSTKEMNGALPHQGTGIIWYDCCEHCPKLGELPIPRQQRGPSEPMTLPCSATRIHGLPCRYCYVGGKRIESLEDWVEPLNR